MEVQEAIETRKSVRGYEDTPVPEDILNRILEAGRMAPSAVNRQPWHFIVVRDQGIRDELGKSKFARHLREAPVVIVGCGDRERSPDWYRVDTTIALHQMVLMATAEGLATCWTGDFDREAVEKVLEVPGHMEVVAMLSIGYPKKKMDLSAKFLRARKRREMEEIVSLERYGG
ncbi:MAG: nitroreductase family protein [Methanomassiliicoccales archaeon]